MKLDALLLAKEITCCAHCSNDSPCQYTSMTRGRVCHWKRRTFSKFAGVVDEKFEVGLELRLLSKVFTVFHTAAVYSWIYTGKL